MIKRTISIVTIVLVILGVGIVVTKASPRVNEHEVGNQRVYAAGNESRVLVPADFHYDVAEVAHQRVQVELQDVRVLDEGVHRDVEREMTEQFVRNEVEDLRSGVAANVRSVLLNVDDREDYVYLNNRRNHVDVMAHLNLYSYLAVPRLRVRFPRHHNNVLFSLRSENLQNASVLETVQMLKEVLGDDVLAAPVLTSFVVSGAKVHQRMDVGKTVSLVRKGAVNVTENQERGLTDV